jgi:uncharacterized protein YxjI
MSTQNYTISNLDLTDDQYTVEQNLVRNKYEAVDSSGNTVLKGKQKMLKMKEQFPFTDADGNDVFEVKAGGIVDVAGNYMLRDAQTGEDLVVLDNDYSILQDTWKIRDPDTEAILAEINSRGGLVTLARNALPFGELIPHKYEITDQEGNHVGSIHGEFSMKDRYEITIDDSTGVPKEATIAAAMVIDAIQEN